MYNVRKQQISLIQKAESIGNFSKSQIDVLSREDLTMEVLNMIFRYLFLQNRNGQDCDLTAAEADKWSTFLVEKKKQGRFIDKCDFIWIFNHILPSCDEKDMMLGNSNKMKLYRAYRFMAQKKLEFFNLNELSEREKNDIEEECINLYNIFADWLRNDMALKTVKDIIRFSATHRGRAQQIRTALKKYKALEDDYFHNGEKSLIVYLIKNTVNVIDDFEPTETALNLLYDFDSHKFRFDYDDFHKYFTCETDSYYNRRYNISQTALLEIAKNNYPIVETILNFCKNNKFIKEKYDSIHSDVFGTWNKWGLWDQSQLPKLKECFKVLGRAFKTDLGAWSMHVKISTNYFVTVTYNEYKSVLFVGKKNAPYKQYEDGWTAEYPNYTVKLLITPDGKIFRTYGTAPKKKNIPLAFKDLFFLGRKPNAMKKFTIEMVDFHKVSSPFIGDLFNDCQSHGCLLPINFNDTIGYYNRAQFIKERYKTANKLKINWNKLNINLSYLIIKAQTWIEPGTSQQILIQQKDNNLIPDAQYRRGVDSKIIEFLLNVICNKISDSQRQSLERKIVKMKKECQQELQEIETDILPEELTNWTKDRINDANNQFELRRIVSDYINMCRRTKRKIRLDIRSVEQIENLHDGLAFGGNYQRTRTAAVKVPKKSKFNKLRTILPEEFEWIKTRKRLILETELQHHCVWSYADRITSDICAIYSYVDKTGEFADDKKPKRYTIEFIVDSKGKYKIEQVQGKYDRIHTEKMRDYIQKILDNKQNNKEVNQ